MKIDKLFNKKPTFSVEIFPPKKTSSIEGLYNTLTTFEEIKPDFISVTYGAGGGKAGDATCKLVSCIKRQLHIEPLAHMTCVNSTKDQVLENIKKLQANNIENILALRGDILDNAPEELKHASDLVKLIKENSNMNVVGACYPEGHYENKNLNDDINNLHYKIDAGVTHLITQLFFDNSKFFNFMDLLRNKNINVPVEAGIMPIVSLKQIERTVALSGASLPTEFTHIISRYSNNSEALFHAGIAYSIEQITELLEQGVDGIHLYTMNNARVAKLVYEGVKNNLGR